MWHNSFGSKFRISIWGASHTPEMGVRIEGVPSGIALSESDFEGDLSRRRASAKGTTARHEKDIPTIVAGVADGVTTGEPVEILFHNGDTRSSDYSQFEAHNRPSHVDFTARAKYGADVDLRGSGQFSGRMTKNFSVSVVLPASGCEIIANVRRLLISLAISAIVKPYLP